jgi:hypothetical protein
MKTIVGVVLVGLFIFGGAARSEDYYYYNGSGRVDLTVSPTSVTVRLDYSEFTTFSALIASDVALDASVEPFELADSLVERLLSNPAIEDACPSFIDPTESEIYLTSCLGVIFKPTTTRADWRRSGSGLRKAQEETRHRLVGLLRHARRDSGG